MRDTEKPKIYHPNFKKGSWMTNHKFLTIKISDALSGIKSFDAYIDGEWILMEYDLKRKQLSYDFRDKKLVGSKHIFKLVVSDHVGNTKNLQLYVLQKVSFISVRKFLFVVFLVPVVVFSQKTAIVKGFVTNKQNKPIENVTVSFDNTGTSTKKKMAIMRSEYL